jgi:hypothetical protein
MKTCAQAPPGNGQQTIPSGTHTCWAKTGTPKPHMTPPSIAVCPDARTPLSLAHLALMGTVPPPCACGAPAGPKRQEEQRCFMLIPARTNSTTKLLLSRRGRTTVSSVHTTRTSSVRDDSKKNHFALHQNPAHTGRAERRACLSCAAERSSSSPRPPPPHR